jgi:hypothetical protein
MQRIPKTYPFRKMLIENEKNMLLRNWIVCFQVSPTRADFTRGCPIGPGLRGRRTPAAADADGGSASSSNTSSISSSSCHDMAAYAIRPFMSPKDSDGFTLDQGWLATACSSDQCWNNKLFFLMVHISFSSNTWYRYIYMYLFNKYSKNYTYSIYLSSLSIYLSESKFIYIYTYIYIYLFIYLLKIPTKSWHIWVDISTYTFPMVSHSDNSTFA